MTFNLIKFVNMKFLNYLFFLFFTTIATQTIAQLNIFKNYNLKDGLPSLNIIDITQDNDGYLWFASNKGITRFDGIDFINYKNKLAANNTTTIAATKNSLYIGTNNGLSIKNNNDFYNFEDKKINCILTTPKHTFLGTEKGILRVREDFLSNIRTNFQIDLNTINDLKFNGEFYWVATNKALWKLDNLINPTLLKRIDLDHYTAILFDENKTIATTYNNGVKLIVNDTIKTTIGSIKSTTNIKNINNQFWVISKNEGIEIFDKNLLFVKNINKYNTLKTNRIHTVFQDQQKNIWIATKNQGVYKLKSKTTLKSKPVITFQNIEIVYKSLDSININKYNKTLPLKPTENHISFTYKTVNINAPKNILYRYKLNNKYSNWTNKNTVDFPYLNPGNYTFTVQSKISKTISKPIQFHFFIDTPIHQKKWFKLSLIAFVALFISTLLYTYIKRIRAKNKAKIDKLKLENHLLSLEQKALQLQMNPHFIFNVLNGIKALGNNGKIKELNTTVGKFATLLRGILHNSRQEEINLSEEITILKNYIELEQQMSLHSFEYEINTTLNLNAEEVLVPPMLIQPFIENSIKHGINTIKNGKIIVNFYSKKSFLHCCIIDNGIGIHQSKKQQNSKQHNSLAISITKERIKSIAKKSTFNAHEIKEKDSIIGTKIEFKIPLKTDF